MSDKQIVVPDYLRKYQPEVDSTKDMITETGSAPRISLKGRQFRFKVEGEEIFKTSDPISVVIVGVVPEGGLMARTYYINGYTPGSDDPPDCSSFFGEIPDAWCQSPQSRFCKDCPQAKWGSAKSMSGGKAQACKVSKRIMVYDASQIDQEDKTLYLMNVTVASLKALSAYGKWLVSNHLPMSAVFTKVSFIDSDFPQVEFTFDGVLEEKNGIEMIAISERKEWMDTKPDSSKAPQIEAPADMRQQRQLPPKPQPQPQNRRTHQPMVQPPQNLQQDYQPPVNNDGYVDPNSLLDGWE